MRDRLFHSASSSAVSGGLRVLAPISPLAPTAARRASLTAAAAAAVAATSGTTAARARRDSSAAATPTRRASTRSGVYAHIRDGCSLDRDNNVSVAKAQREPRVYAVPSATNANAPNNSLLHSNEKLVTNCDGYITQLSARSAFYRPYDSYSSIGRGNFSRVFLLHNLLGTPTKSACKEIDKERMAGRCDYVYNEIHVLNSCEHTHIVRLLEAYESPAYFFLVFEYAAFGDLFEFVKRTGIPSETNSACITYQVGLALSYLHRRSIVHRDVKLENILIVSESCVKLTDFGLACAIDGPLYRICGTPKLVAPEVIAEQGYGVEVDVWSLGVTHALTLVRRMLTANPRRRITAGELLDDRWICSRIA